MPDLQHLYQIDPNPVANDERPDEREFPASMADVAASQGEMLETISGLDQAQSQPLCGQRRVPCDPGGCGLHIG